jgi:hypothetical protein
MNILRIYVTVLNTELDLFVKFNKLVNINALGSFLIYFFKYLLIFLLKAWCHYFETVLFVLFSKILDQFYTFS